MADKILVIAHGAKLDGKAYKKLNDAGYIVLRGDPQEFHVLETLSVADVDGNVLADAAFATLRVDWNCASGRDVRSRWAFEILNRLSPKPPT